jgi:hypothetical protein
LTFQYLNGATDPTARSTSKPTLHLATVVGSCPARPNDKLLITIRHPPTDKENKFKVKATHTVGRVLSSACLAFGLNAGGYVYYSYPVASGIVSVVRKADLYRRRCYSASLMHWSEEDGLETSYRCGNDLSMGSVAGEGAVFIIELAK